jgi:superfamily I DNA/RNA helicase
MDGFAPARLAAARLRANLLAAGADPARPLALVEAAARHLDIELQYLPPGDPGLKGARALYDPAWATIYATQNSHPAQSAEDIGHELGHAVLHREPAQCTPRDLESTGEGEVYGARERRELEVNVFSRCLFLSHDEARRLHLEEHLGAAAIAERFSLRIDVVRRQLLEALLLTPTLPTAPSPRTLIPPDPSQAAAAAHRGSPFLLQAGPGTGKTQTVTHRLRSLIDDAVDPASILVLTYSNRAAAELSERVAASLGAAGNGIWIGTFHAFGLDLVRRHHAELGLDPDLYVLDQAETIALLEDLLPRLPLEHYRNLWEPTLLMREVLRAIARAKDEISSPSDYGELALRMRNRARSDEEHAAASRALEVARVYEIYDRALRERGAVDFGDLVMRPALLLEQDERARTGVQERHLHVIVDEYQDVNRASVRLLRALAGGGERLWVVGDARQSIYRFRGARSSNMARFTTDFPGAQVASLDVGYRSSSEIAACLAELAPKMAASEGMPPLRLTSVRGPSGVRPVVRCFETLADEAEGVATSIEELAAGGVPFCEQAVLCRKGDRLDAIAAVLTRREIPVLRLGNLFERDEVRDVLAVCSLAVDPFGHGLPRIAAMPRYAIPLQDVRTAVRLLSRGPEPATEKLAGVLGSAELSEAGARGLGRLVADLHGIPARASAWELCTTYLLDRTDLLAEIASSTRFEDRVRGLALGQLLDFLASSRLPIHETLDRVRDMVLLGEDRDLYPLPDAAFGVDAVRLMTIHGSKGLEFEAVHLPGLAVSSLPLSYWPPRCPAPDGLVEGDPARDHVHGEECLFFVAVSRARRVLRLYRARRRERGWSRSASPFLTWMTVEQEGAPAEPTRSGRKERDDALIDVRRADGCQLTDRQLEAYERCPRRFFYTDVLGLGGARSATAFGTTHDCVYEVIAWAAEQEATPTGEQALEELTRVWREKGPAKHAYEAEYWALATRLAGALVKLGGSHARKSREPIELAFENGRVVVQPDEVAERDEKLVVRRVRTGQAREDATEGVGVALVQLAAQQRFAAQPGGVAVELVHLTDESVTPVEMTPKTLEERRRAVEGMLSSLAAGRFPAEAGRTTCARCPHLFGCGIVASGHVSIP